MFFEYAEGYVNALEKSTCTVKKLTEVFEVCRESCQPNRFSNPETRSLPGTCSAAAVSTLDPSFLLPEPLGVLAVPRPAFHEITASIHSACFLCHLSRAWMQDALNEGL